jgi:TrpR-related protein YerC/YecD
MGKFSAKKFLTKQEIEELFIDFATAVTSLRNAIEATNFIKDLLSEPEVIMLARRLQIARLLNNGYTYEQIHRAMKVSNSTIAKVQTWMSLYGEGYRTVLERTKNKVSNSHSNEREPWSKFKKKYPMYFWPQLLLEDVVRSANKKEKERLQKVLTKLKEKTQLSRQLTKILQIDKSYHTL